MEPSSANENAPKIERTAPTIHAAKTMETLLPSRAISAGFRKIPVPIMVPTTMAAEAQAPRPRTKSSRFSLIKPLRRWLSRWFVWQCNAGDQGPDHECHARANEDIPRKRYGRETKNAQDGCEAGEHADQRATRVGVAIECAEQKETQQAAEGRSE